MSKPTIYVDCDDTILSSSKTVIRILNQRYGLNKTIDDMTDWFYRSIAPRVTQEEIMEIYESDEFWNDAELDEGFLKVFDKLKNDFHWVVLSRGTEENLKRKKTFIEQKLHIPLIGLLSNSSEENCSTKKMDMSGCIQIDDHMGCLHKSSASVKVLFQNGRRFRWNQPEPNEDNLYAAMTWKEIGELLEFFHRNPDMIVSK